MFDATKQLLASTLCSIGVDSLSRYVSRRKLLVVMYHGVTRRQYKVAPWTQLPEAAFLEQVAFLSTHYNLLRLEELVECVREMKELPERSALITFDDGLRNNFTVAYPILARFGAPATIFLATDYIGTQRLYWFDELFLVLSEKEVREGVATEIARERGLEIDTLSEKEVYFEFVEYLKRAPEVELEAVMSVLKRESTCDFNRFDEDFKVLDWTEIDSLNRTGLIEFGVHTASHRILTSLPRERWEDEIGIPRRTLSCALERDVVAFAYPNGRPGVDYTEAHRSYLKNTGYLCAFSTFPSLAENDPQVAFDLSRIPAGNDRTSEPCFFRLMCSGFPWLFPRYQR